VAVKIRAFVAIVVIAAEDAGIVRDAGNDPDGHPPAVIR
jgi:hypothetical protein